MVRRSWPGQLFTVPARTLVLTAIPRRGEGERARAVWATWLAVLVSIVFMGPAKSNESAIAQVRGWSSQLRILHDAALRPPAVCATCTIERGA